MEENNFWKNWLKFVMMLIGILCIWIIIIFIGEHFFHEEFEKIKFVHYFILLFMILKAKKIFLKNIDFKKENKTDDSEKSNETI